VANNTEGPTQKSIFDLEAENQELRQANVRLQRSLSSAKAKTGELVAAVERAAKDAALVVGAPAVTRPKSDRRRGKAEVALLHATDWQYGKRTLSYNSGVAHERLAKVLPNKLAKLTDIQRADHPVRKLVLMLGGDMVEGVSIFPGQAFEVDSTLYEQLFASAHTAETLIRSCAEMFEQVEVWTEYGNHGRIGRRGDVPGQDNIDLMLYRILADRTRDLKRVQWHISTNWHQIVIEGNYRALLVHGDEIKSFGGQTPAFGIARKVNGWAAGVIDPFIDAYMGHFHQPLVIPLSSGLGRIFLTPSPESDNQFAKEFVAASGTPAQRLHFVDTDRARVTAEYLVYLDEPSMPIDKQSPSS